MWYSKSKGKIMRYLKKTTLIISMLMVSGCATFPTGPSVNVMPSQGKNFDVFLTEDAKCRQWAEQHGGSAQDSYPTIEDYGREAQRRYDNAYVQCMYSYGNQVPGHEQAATAAPNPAVAAPPPPPATPPVATTPPQSATPPVVVAQMGDVPPDAVAPPDNTPPPPPPETAPAPGQYASPPPVYIDQAPQFIYSPQLGMYVAVGVPYDIVYTGNEYFYWYGGRWYHGPYYNGPWAFATRAYYPPALLRFRIGYIRQYRNYEYRQWQRHGRNYRGRFHRPAFRR
jgi:hypothetical protein